MKNNNLYAVYYYTPSKSTKYPFREKKLIIAESFEECFKKATSKLNENLEIYTIFVFAKPSGFFMHFIEDEENCENLYGVAVDSNCKDLEKKIFENNLNIVYISCSTPKRAEEVFIEHAKKLGVIDDASVEKIEFDIEKLTSYMIYTKPI